MIQLENYVEGQWLRGQGSQQSLYDAVTGECFGTTSTQGLDFKAMIHYARNTGNPALRNLSFHERGNRLKALAFHLQKHLSNFYSLSYRSGATKAHDGWHRIRLARLGRG